MKTIGKFSIALVALAIGLTQKTVADTVVDWNAITAQAIATAVPPRPGPSSVLDFAMVQAAVYDAVEAIDGRFEPYYVEIPGASGSPAAAAASAAHGVLVNRFPGQSASLQKTRTYSRFSDAADDVVNARIYEGIHFRFADTVARRQGKHVADWAFHHFLRPLGDGNDNDDGDQDNDE